MKKQGFTLVEVMIVIMVMGLLMTILVPHALRIRLLANESSAQATLKAISVALESYANDNGSNYPTNPALLLSANPSYITIDYFSTVNNGYIFTHQIFDHSYLITATPLNANSGSQIFSIATGGFLGSGIPPAPPAP
ncbi:MAG: hypothetical protein A2787_04815 [Omnitrophica WOR_2 bacterium RIFCSPHIGHO2_01_FULL_48_9]|nr:MAG: hypothetical protein A3D10_03625 [Omnitrophica WOR_2 bacterium RIFCSPHIGHO2_02_FULL_48_11]OGX33241.1 MAG: hypothetical protein A2787_04815 [Omnitrophica WOR_2 bacterium RIFCSPHIGHO2_01_FULL_48_9]